LVKAFRHLARISNVGQEDTLGTARVIIWLDDNGRWGGVIEPLKGALRASLAQAEAPLPWHLRLDDGREGDIEVTLSQFVADGVRPLQFAGRGALARPRSEAPHG